MTLPYARGTSRARANAGLEKPFDWIDQVLSHPKVVVIGAKGSGKRQYLASLPYAEINWENRDNIIAVVPAGTDTVAQMANALYFPGEHTDDGRAAAYHIVVRNRTVRKEDLFGGHPVTLADVPSVVVREPNGLARINHAVWHENPVIDAGSESLPVRDFLATAIGIVFVIDPLTSINDNAFVADVLEAIEEVHAEWREAGVSSLPAGDRRIPVAVIATKTDALHPSDPRLDDGQLAHFIGKGQSDRVSTTKFVVHCAAVSAWGDGAGFRFSGTRFQPTDVLQPLRELFRSFPRLIGTQVWDMSREAE